MTQLSLFASTTPASPPSSAASSWYFRVVEIPSLRYNQGKPCAHCGRPVYGVCSKVVPVGEHPFPPTGRDGQGFGWYVCHELERYECATQIILTESQRVRAGGI